MFEDSLIESGGQIKTKKGTTVLISTMVHVVLITVLILDPADFVFGIAEATAHDDAGCSAATAAAAAAAAGRSCSGAPVVIKQVQIDPGTIVQPTEIPKEIARIVESRSAVFRTGSCRRSRAFRRVVRSSGRRSEAAGRSGSAAAATAATAATAAAATRPRWWKCYRSELGLAGEAGLSAAGEASAHSGCRRSGS